MKEVGVRKVVGAQRNNIIKQFLTENMLLSLIAIVISIIFTLLLTPFANGVTGLNYETTWSGNISLILIMFFTVVLSGILSSSYQAIFISAFKPVKVLKGPGDYGKSGKLILKKLMIVIQYSFTIILIIVTVGLVIQFRFAMNKDLGFDKNNLLFFPGYGKFSSDFDNIRNELLNYPDIMYVSRCHPPPEVSSQSTSEFDWEGKDKSKNKFFRVHPVDYDFLKTFDLKLAEGRFFSREFSSEEDNYVLNQTAVKSMGLQSPIGKRIKYSGITDEEAEYSENEGTIIGVIKDYHIRSLFEKIPPIILKLTKNAFYISLKIRSSDVSRTISFLENKWNELVPGQPFKYHFLDEQIENYYHTERNIVQISNYFAVVAVVISFLGLFGLSAFSTERRTKEIGIRKVLGASVLSIVYMFCIEFVKWVAVSVILAFPAGYLAINILQEKFVYRAEMGLKLFLISGLLAFLIALFSVSYQSIKSARLNPVDTLRYE
jgi:putative ABC transport system permease protein